MRTLLSIAVFAALASAQTTVSIVTSGPVAAFADNGTAPAFQGVAAGTAVANSPRNLFLSARCATGEYASATTIAYPTQPYQEGIGLNFFERAYVRGSASTVAGSSASASASGAALGPHALLATFSNAPGTAGRIRFDFRANPGTTGAVFGSIDIDADGTVEASTNAGQSFDIPYVIGTSGTVDVLITNECMVTGTGSTLDFQSCWTEAFLGFFPDLTATCTFTNYGQGCGATLQGGEVILGANRVVTLLATGAFPNSPALFVTGSSSLAIPLPGNCSLLSTVEIVDVEQADAVGNVTHTWTFPVIATGTSFHQVLPVRLVNGAVELLATDGLRIECR